MSDSRAESEAVVNESRNSEAGFTLVEIVAALAILALSLGALFGVLSDGIGRAGHAEAHAQAGSLAQSLLARAGAEIPLQKGIMTGEFPQGYGWRLQMEPYGDSADHRAWPVAAFSVSAEIVWGQSPQQQSIVLTTLRIVATEPPR